MAVNCCIYGLGFQFNTQLDALADLPKCGNVDVYVDMVHGPALELSKADLVAEEFYVSVHCDGDGVPEFRASYLSEDRIIRVTYSDGVVFDLDTRGQRITVFALPDQLFEELAPALLGPVMGMFLRIRGITCLHASAVEIDGQAIGLVGESGAGKSTTAAAFAVLGNSVLTDDVLALTDDDCNFLVQPAYPRIRLWPESVAGLFGSVDVLPRMMPGWDKRFLSLQRPGFCFQSKPLPLAALYFLGPRCDVHTDIVIESVSPAKALMMLVSESFATNFQDKSKRAAEFNLLSRLVIAVPLRRVSAPNDLKGMNYLCSAISQDLSLQCPTAEAL